MKTPGSAKKTTKIQSEFTLITITLQNHMSTEKFYQYLHKKQNFLRHL